LNHPNIVTIHDFGQAGGFYFLLMEFVDGLNLRQLLQTRKFTPEEALAIVPSLCDALQFAHDRGIVHRDIKPENILLDKTGRVKVADFGIAKMLGTGNGGATTGAAAAPASATHSTLGTPGYSAPEQKTDPQRVDSRADIYSLGVVFYELLTGELPGKPLQPPSKKVQIDVRLDEVVLRALEQKPELRYQQASVLKTQVETIATSAAPGRSPNQAEVPQSFPKWLLFRIGLPKWREFPVIGVRDGQRVIHWPGVAFRILVALAVSAPLVYAVNGADAVDPFLPVFFVVISIWLGIKCLRDWAQPIEKLSCLDEPSIDAPSATPPSETATASGKPWVSFCVTLTYLGTGLFGLPPSLFGLPRSLFHNHLLNQWSVGIFVELICLTSLLALLLNQLATPQAWRKWFKLAAWLGMVAWLLAIGSALFALHFIYGLDQEATLLLLNQWSVGIFIKLMCLTSLLALLLNQLATSQAWRKRFKLAAWLGMVAWLLAIGSALFALCLRYGLDQRATLDDTIFESFILLGAIALPICIVRLWRAANKPMGSGGKATFRPWWKRWWVSVVVGIIVALVLRRGFVAFQPKLLLAVAAGLRAMNARQRTDVKALKAALVTTNFYIGQSAFPHGDSIEITSVSRIQEKMVVKGHYNLISADRAQLALFMTSTNRSSDSYTDQRQWTEIAKGRGDFELFHPHLYPGLPHVTMYTLDTNGAPFAGVYFGTKDEAAEERKLDPGFVGMVGLPAVDESFWEMKVENLKKAPAVVIIRPSRYSAAGSMGSHDGRTIAHNIDFATLLYDAYSFSRQRMILPASVPEGQFDLMLTLRDHPTEALQKAIQRQFGFTARRETREMDVLWLKVKDPTLLALHTSASGSKRHFKSGKGMMAWTSCPMAFMVEFLEGNFGKPVMVRPELSGKYDITFQEDAQDMEQALADELAQAGLELVPGREPIEMLVVEKAN
jgi:uncharacterized protein (TIGR03435 family)